MYSNSDPRASTDIHAIRLLASKQFIFHIGPDKKEFHVSQDAIATLSPVLHSLVKNNAFLEANEGKVVWDDVDTGIFAQFCQFAYTGDYQELSEARASDDAVAKVTAGGQVTQGSGDGADAAEDSVDLWTLEDHMVWDALVPGKEDLSESMTPTTVAHTSKSRKKKSQREPTMVKLIGEHYICPCGRALVAGQRCGAWGGGCGMTAPQESAFPAVSDIEAAVLSGNTYPDFTDTALTRARYARSGESGSLDPESLLADAKLYVLGDKWNINSLKALALRNLQGTMGRITLSKAAGFKATIELVRYTYDNTATETDLLRGLVTHFVVAKITENNLGCTKGFLDLLEDLPSFARTVWKVAYELRMV